jgi:predicted nucleic acid-binding protein
MNVEFVDTNVVIYAHGGSAAGAKHEAAAKLMERLWVSQTGALSVQVLSEFFSAATAKFRMPVKEAEEVIRLLGHWRIHRPGHGDIIRAITLQQRHKLSWWDALILNSAIELGATTLWTEDFNDGQKFGALTVRNPFH